MSGGPDDGKDANQLIARVDALIKRQQEDSLRAVEEVPLLTEIVEHDAAAAAARRRRAMKRSRPTSSACWWCAWSPN